METHPTSFPGNKAHPVKSKYKKLSQPPPKHIIKDVPVQTQRRTFGTIRNHNVISLPEKTVPQKPKTKPKTTQNPSSEKPKLKNKKAVCLPEKSRTSVKEKSSANEEIDVVKTPVRTPFSVKPVRSSGTPYLSAEKCGTCRFDRLETASYWVGQIRSAETVSKHFVAAAFFRLAYECKAEPMRNLQIELKRYLTRYDDLSTMTEWEDVTRIYGKLRKEKGAKNSGEKMSCFCEKTVSGGGSEIGEYVIVQKQSIEENGLDEMNK